MSAQVTHRSERRGRPRQHAFDEGFTLIELLVVILIIGILAAVAIPTFLAQTSKSTDAAAKEVARTAETTAETYAIDHGGTYNGISPPVLNEYEKSIQISPGNNAAWLVSAEATEGGEGYKVTAKATDGHTFTVNRLSTGVIERTCTTTPEDATGAAGGGCQKNSW